MAPNAAPSRCHLEGERALFRDAGCFADEPGQQPARR
jgi:hypothetical protein